MNKKAISPMVSTVILLGFAVALGLIVMGWGGEIKQNGFSECNSVRVNFIMIDNNPKVCYNDEGVEFMLENTGDIDINGLKLNIIGELEITKVEIEQSIQVGDVLRMVAPYDRQNLGSIKLIKIFPRIKENYCGDSQLELAEINVCE